MELIIFSGLFLASGSSGSNEGGDPKFAAARPQGVHQQSKLSYSLNYNTKASNHSIAANDGVY
jgi:hypothetical protein